MTFVVCITAGDKGTIYDQLFANCIAKISSKKINVNVIRQLNFFLTTI
jgi:hypothetical protein